MQAQEGVRAGLHCRRGSGTLRSIIVQAPIRKFLNRVEAPPSWLDKAEGVLRKKTGSRDVGSSAAQAWGSYDPSQWDYRIDPDGVVAKGGNNNA